MSENHRNLLKNNLEKRENDWAMGRKSIHDGRDSLGRDTSENIYTTKAPKKIDGRLNSPPVKPKPNLSKMTSFTR